MSEQPLAIANGLEVFPRHLIGQRIAVLGTSGMGKSNTVTVLVEQLSPHLPFAIVDPHNEYYGLCEKFTFLRAGKAPDVQIEAGPLQADMLAEFSFKNRISVILSMLFMDEDERLEFVHAFCARLWELNLLVKQPYGIVLDEAQNFIPQNAGRSPALKKLKQFALEGRKFGFTTILSSQRTAEVNKTILGQCGIAFLHGVDIHNDVEAYAGMLPYTMTETKKIALQLGVGEAIVKFKPEGRALFLHPIKINQRQTFDAAQTPGAEVEQMLQTAPKLDNTMIEALQHVIQRGPEADAPPVAPPTDAAAQKLEAENAALAEELVKAKQRITELEAQLATTEIAPPPDKPKYEGDRTALATTRTINYQKCQFAALLDDLRIQPAMHRHILGYLAKRDSRTFMEHELVRYIGIGWRTLANQRPAQFKRLGLLDYTLNDTHKAYIYRSRTREFIQEKYPDLDADELMEQFFKLESA